MLTVGFVFCPFRPSSLFDTECDKAQDDSKATKARALPLLPAPETTDHFSSGEGGMLPTPSRLQLIMCVDCLPCLKLINYGKSKSRARPRNSDSTLNL